MNDKTKDYVLIQPPSIVGHWALCGSTLQFSLTKRPSKWHQFWCAYLIGWKWVDHDD